MTSIYKFSINIVILLCLALLLAQTASAQTVFQGSTWSDFPGGAKAVCDDDDIDNDNDELIELCYLEDVNAIRYNLEGTSYKSSMNDATGVVTGCHLVEGEEKCKGYELVRDLDFTDDGSYSSATNIVKWTTGEGWQPIGDSTNSFNSIFEGNGHTISNLTINRSDTDYVGLFGYTGSSSKISNIGLLNVDIDGNVDTAGEGRVGGLVGQNDGSIANSYVTGFVDAGRNVGGLVGWNSGNIANSYATGSITGGEQVGGLVGRSGGSIANNYATASLKAKGSVGGLAGYSFRAIINSYATGFIEATGADVGGVCGFCFNPTKKSYWDTDTSKILTSVVGTSKTTAELQMPTTATGIYSSWSTKNWDFGTPDKYPALKHARGNDADNPACGTSQQPACGALLRGQERNSQPRIIDPQNNDEIRIRKSEADMTKTIDVTVFDYNVRDELTLLLSTVDVDQNLVILETTKTTVMTNGESERDINEDLSIKAPQEIISGETTLQLVAVDDSGSGNAMSEPILLQVLVGNIQPTIMPIADIELIEGLSTTLTVVVEDDDSDPINVSLENDNSGVAEVKATDDAGRILQITARDEGMAMITVTADDGTGEANSVTTATFTVTVLPNEAPKIVTVPASVTVREGREATFNVMVSDADIDDVLTLELTAANPRQEFVELVTKTVEVATNSAETRAMQTLRIKGLKKGTATLDIVVSDGVAESQPASVEITVERNSTPTITITPEPLDISLLKGTSATFNVTATDADSDDTDIRVRVMSKHITIATAELVAAEGSGYSLIIEAIEAGTAEIEVSANDRRGTANSTATKTFTVTVVANQAPMVVIQNVTTQVVTIGETLSLKTGDFFEDPDGDELSYEVSGFPDGYNFSFSTTTGVLMVTPGIGNVSTDMDGLSVTVTATDSNGISAKAMFTLLINAEASADVTINFDTWQLTTTVSNAMDANGISGINYQWFRNNEALLNETTKTYSIEDNPLERAGGTEYKVDVGIRDNIGQVTTFSGVYTVVNKAPTIPAIELEEVDEGEQASITADASDANNDDLTYTWKVTSRDKDPSILADAIKTNGQISFDVPADWVVKASTATGVTETLQLQVSVSDGNLNTTQTATVVITKIDNDKVDTPSISVDQANLALLTLDEIDLESDSDGENDNPNINYQWQRCPANTNCSSNWEDIGTLITDAANRSLTVTDFGGEVGDKFRVKITYTDKQGYRADDFFSIAKDYTGRSAVKVRVKVFLEGPLQ